KIIVGELAPLLLNLAPELFPIAFDTIPIHHFAPVCFVPVAGMPSRRTQRASKSSDARCGLQRRAVAVKDAAPLLQKTGAWPPSRVDYALANRPSTGRGKWAAGYP